MAQRTKHAADLGLDWQRPRISQVLILLEELGQSYGKAQFVDMVKPIVSEMQARLAQPTAGVQEQKVKSRRKGAARLRGLEKRGGDADKLLHELEQKVKSRRKGAARLRTLEKRRGDADKFLYEFPIAIGYSKAIRVELSAMGGGVSNVPHEQLRHASLMASVQHLMDPENRFSFSDRKKAAEVETWLAWERLHLFEKQMQAIDFYRGGSDEAQPGQNPVQQAEQLYSKLDALLTDRKYLVGPDGGKYTMADISCFCWVNTAHYSGIIFEQFPNVRRWWASIESRKAVQDVMEEHGTLMKRSQCNTRLLELMQKDSSIRNREERLKAFYKIHLLN
ncbi:glutathione S-transferase [Phyllosticta capitalensis]